MSHSEATSGRMKLLPHQQALVDELSGLRSQTVCLLRAEVGMGKTAAFIALASQLVWDNPAARILFVVSSVALREQFASRLGERHVRTLLGDRYSFRELLDANATWPEGHVVVMGREFARKQDVLASLARGRWALAVIDDAKPSPTGTQLIQVLAPVSDRLLVSTANNVAPSVLFSGPVPTIEWVRDKLVDLNGEPLDSVARPDIRVVRFGRTPSERRVFQDVRAALASEPTWVRATIGRSLRSGLASLEATLRSLLTSDSLYQSHDGDGHSANPSASLSETGRANLVGVLARLEQLQEDSKLQRLVVLVGGLPFSRRVCILSDSVSTIYSIVTELEDIGRPCVALHGGMSVDDRDAVCRAFYQQQVFGGRDEHGRRIVVATRHMMSDSAWGQDTDDLILYDVPAGAVATEDLIRRFDRLGRREQLTVYEFNGPDSAR